MKAKAIVRIVICSVLAVVFAVLLMAVLRIKGVDTDAERKSFFGISLSDTEDDYARESVPALNGISRLQISWSRGRVLIFAYDGEELRVSEGLDSLISGENYLVQAQDLPQRLAPQEKDRLYWKLEGDQLCIRETEGALRFLAPEKVLLVLVPRGELERIELELSSAAVEIEGLCLTQLTADTASGDLRLRDCTVKELAMDSASGDLELQGEVGQLTADTASGDLRIDGYVKTLEMNSASGELHLSARKAPQKIEFDTTSGKAELNLPKDSSFTAEIDSVSGGLGVTGFAGSMEDGCYIAGDGTGDYCFDTVSGDVRICAAD